MNKILNLILKLVQKEYPHITRMKYNKDLIFYFNIDKLREQFPDGTLDHHYITNHLYGMGLPTEVFNEFFDNDQMNEGSIISLIEILKKPIDKDDKMDIIFYIEK